MTHFFQHSFADFRILQIPVLTDNYIYIICESENAIVVDPALALPVNEVLKQENLILRAIVNTHHHPDHIGGNRELSEQWGCPVYGYKNDRHRIPNVSHPLNERDHISWGSLTAKVLFIPGHTLGHIAYYFKEQNWVFSGDTLFSLGCGRLFEGTAKQMQQSLSQLRQLPPETLIFCSHEYTKDNLNFSLSILPEDLELKNSKLRITELLLQKKPTVPMPLKNEILSNLFLRWDDQKLKAQLSLNNAPDWEVFAKLRSAKDIYPKTLHP